MSPGLGESVISVVLLPSPVDSQQLIECSQRISEHATSHIQLSDKFLPHISLAQFLAPAEEAAALWEQVRHLKGRVRELVSAGLTFAPDPREDALWVELSFLKSAAAVQLQAQIAETDFAKQFKVHNHTGDGWRPHATLALLSGHSIPALNLMNVDLLKRSFVNLSLAVGINGEYWTFVTSQFS